jgi:hypothetical protein
MRILQAHKLDRAPDGGDVVSRPATELRTQTRRTVRLVGRPIQRSRDPILTLIHKERVCHRVGRRPPEHICLNAPEPVA